MQTHDNTNVDKWRIRKLIKTLNNARGNGTSMLTLVIPPNDKISRVSKMLADELGTASNIKSRVNRQSVTSALVSMQQRLKLHRTVPPNGLVLYFGEVEGDQKVSIDFEPFKPINTSMYRCDSKFHTDFLADMLDNDDTYGFIVVDGNGCLYGTLSGNTRRVLQTISVELPKKHGRGGQSALRFERIRRECRHNYLRKVAEIATQLFVTNDTVNVAGLFLCGSAEFKVKLSQSGLFDKRLSAVVLRVVDVAYGGENGFNQAIEMVAETISEVAYVTEKKALVGYFGEIARDTGKYCFGVKDTIDALEMGALEELIVWENLVADHESGDLLEFLTTRYKDWGASLTIVSDRSPEGTQFVKGFGGIGGRLRYAVAFQQEEMEDGEDWC